MFSVVVVVVADDDGGGIFYSAVNLFQVADHEDALDALYLGYVMEPAL